MEDRTSTLKRRLHELFLERFKGRIGAIDKTGKVAPLSSSRRVPDKLPELSPSPDRKSSLGVFPARRTRNRYRHILNTSSQLSIPIRIIRVEFTQSSSKSPQRPPPPKQISFIGLRMEDCDDCPSDISIPIPRVLEPIRSRQEIDDEDQPPPPAATSRTNILQLCLNTDEDVQPRHEGRAARLRGKLRKLSQLKIRQRDLSPVRPAPRNGEEEGERFKTSRDEEGGSRSVERMAKLPGTRNETNELAKSAMKSLVFDRTVHGLENGGGSQKYSGVGLAVFGKQSARHKMAVSPIRRKKA